MRLLREIKTGIESRGRQHHVPDPLLQIDFQPRLGERRQKRKGLPGQSELTMDSHILKSVTQLAVIRSIIGPMSR